MFGFGKSAQEKAAVNWVAMHFQQLGISEREALGYGEKIVSEVLQEFRPRGIDPFKATQGDEYIGREQFTAPRVKAGLSIEDIRTHWNRPLLLLFSAVKMQELMNFVVVNSFEQQGKTAREGGIHYKKHFPRYGDPAKWDPKEKFNEGLNERDADVYPEFAARVDRWKAKTEEKTVAALIDQYDAVIRQKVAQSEL